MNEWQAEPEPPVDKPPLSVMPKYLWDEKRMLDLIGAIIRFTEAKEPVPSELSKELADLLTLYPE